MSDQPDYRGFRLKELYVYLVVGPDDEEGIPGFVARTGELTPMIAADRRRLRDLYHMARVMRERGEKVRLVRFTTREEIDEKTEREMVTD